MTTRFETEKIYLELRAQYQKDLTKRFNIDVECYFLPAYIHTKFSAVQGFDTEIETKTVEIKRSIGLIRNGGLSAGFAYTIADFLLIRASAFHEAYDNPTFKENGALHIIFDQTKRTGVSLFVLIKVM